MDKLSIDEGIVWDCPLSFWYDFFDKKTTDNRTKTVEDCGKCQWMSNIHKDFVECKYYDDVIKSGDYE